MTPREEARAWVQRALVSSWPENEPQALIDYGDSLFALAEQHEIRTESLVFWIHDHPTGKDWSLAAWRSWCERYAALRAEVGDDTPPAEPNDSGTPHALCTRCYSNQIQRINGGERAWCAKCGEVQL